jgi:hypothetical protein
MGIGDLMVFDEWNESSEQKELLKVVNDELKIIEDKIGAINDIWETGDLDQNKKDLRLVMGYQQALENMKELLNDPLNYEMIKEGIDLD